MSNIEVDSLFAQVFPTDSEQVGMQDICNRLAQQLHCELALITSGGDVLVSVGALPLSRLRVNAHSAALDANEPPPAVERLGLWQLYHRRLALADGNCILTLAQHRNRTATLTPAAIAAAGAALIAASTMQRTGQHRVLESMSQIVRDLERGTTRALEHHYWPRMEALGFRAHHPVQVTIAQPMSQAPLPRTRLVDLITRASQAGFGLLASAQLVRTTSASATHFLTHATPAARRWLEGQLTDCIIAHSEPVQLLEQIPQALAHAEQTLELAERIVPHAPKTVRPPALEYASLPLSAWAVAQLPPRELLERSRRAIAALDDHSDLRETLVVYLATGQHIPRTASALFLHPNSVRYRLQRIETLCGVRLDDPVDIADLTLAVMPQLLACRAATRVDTD